MRKHTYLKEKTSKKTFQHFGSISTFEFRAGIASGKFFSHKETGACWGFCPTPEQVDEQPSLVFRTTLLKADDPGVQRLKVTWNSAKHPTSLTGSTSSTSGSLSTSHGNPLTTANLTDDANFSGTTRFLISSFLPVNWDTPPRSRKVKVNDFGGTDFLHCHNILLDSVETNLNIWRVQWPSPRQVRVQIPTSPRQVRDDRKKSRVRTRVLQP